MFSPYISKRRTGTGYDFNDQLMAVEVALLLVKAFGENAEEKLALFMGNSKPTDHARWMQVQEALWLYRDMQSCHH